MLYLSVLASWSLSFVSVTGCTAKNHPHLLKKFPKIFSFNPDLARSEKLCAKQAKMTKKTPERDVTSCHLVDVSLHAFLAPTASVCELPSAVNTNSVEDEAECSEVRLVKSSELGLGLALQGSASPATAQVRNYL